MAKAKLMDFDKALELFEPVLGFEVHVELSTKTKMFSAAPNNFGSEPNTNITLVRTTSTRTWPRTTRSRSSMSPLPSTAT